MCVCVCVCVLCACVLYHYRFTPSATNRIRDCTSRRVRGGGLAGEQAEEVWGGGIGSERTKAPQRHLPVRHCGAGHEQHVVGLEVAVNDVGAVEVGHPRCDVGRCVCVCMCVCVSEGMQLCL